jgi:hypothetical protein
MINIMKKTCKINIFNTPPPYLRPKGHFATMPQRQQEPHGHDNFSEVGQ